MRAAWIPLFAIHAGRFVRPVGKQARLTDCELKFQNISDCLRRLIAPLLLRWPRSRARAPAPPRHGQSRPWRPRRRSFIFSIERFFERFRAARHTYIGAFAASGFDKSCRVFYRRHGHAAPLVPLEPGDIHEKYKDPRGLGYSVIRIGDNHLSGRR